MDNSVLSVSGKQASFLVKWKTEIYKLYQINVVVRNDAGRKVKVHCGTEHDEWKDEEMETLSPPTEGRLHLEYTYHSTVQQFYSSSSKRIGRKLDD